MMGSISVGVRLIPHWERGSMPTRSDFRWSNKRMISADMMVSTEENKTKRRNGANGENGGDGVRVERGGEGEGGEGEVTTGTTGTKDIIKKRRRPMTGLAGVGPILPPDPTPWISRQEETEAFVVDNNNVRLLQGAAAAAVEEERKERRNDEEKDEKEKDEKEKDEKDEYNETANEDLAVVDKFSNARDFFLYVNTFVSEIINRSMRTIVLPLMEKPLIQVINLELKLEVGNEKKKKGDGGVENKHNQRNTKLKEEPVMRTAVEMNAEPVVYLDPWVKEAVNDETRRQEIIASHREEHEKQERVTKLYSRDRENDLNRLEKILPASLGEMLWDLNI